MGPDRRPPQSAEELLKRYATGECLFARANLRGANLIGANLRNVDLTNANLSGAHLSGVHLDPAQLWGTDFTGADLIGANLGGARLGRAGLSGAKLAGAHLGGADLSGADLSGADLSNANLGSADLRRADFSSANLCDVEFGDANLSGAVFRGARLGGARLGHTHLIGVDLASFCQADPPIQHDGPSNIDYKSILKSIGSPGLDLFLQRTGMPKMVIEALITSARRLQKESPGLLHSTFLSYGGPDTNFAQKLNDALLKNGVTTFFFAKDAIPGRKLRRVMHDGVNQHDRVILVCSKASLDRPGVLNEITETLQREARDGGKEYLLPITLDDYVFTGWKPEDPGVAQAIRDRVVADFKGADADPAKFNDGVLRLIAALKK